jgi:hypothetical protein
MSLSDDIKKFNKKTQEKASIVFRKTAFDLGIKINYRSPVDSGRFRGNWQTTLNTAPIGELDVVDPDGSLVRNELAHVTNKANLGDKIYFVNNLPYAIPLEYGHSREQAPAGMVRVTVLEFQNIVDSNAKKVASQ